jgi:hypothetical protein
VFAVSQLVRSALLSLITGLMFGLGVFGAYGVYKAVAKALAPAVVEHPGGFGFPEHRRIPQRSRFTVEGVVENTGNRGWSRVRIIAAIYAGDAYMTYCWGGVPEIPPDSRRPFRVVCKHTEGRKVPANIRYRLSVAWATPAGGRD